MNEILFEKLAERLIKNKVNMIVINMIIRIRSRVYNQYRIGFYFLQN
jgi:hypothetical protein